MSVERLAERVGSLDAELVEEMVGGGEDAIAVWNDGVGATIRGMDATRATVTAADRGDSPPGPRLTAYRPPRARPWAPTFEYS